LTGIDHISGWMRRRQAVRRRFNPYIVGTPLLSLKKVVYLDGRQAVLYRSRMNPSLGRNFEAMEPLEWLARVSDHMPDPGQHRTILYAAPVMES